jgi:hypothetical protein
MSRTGARLRREGEGSTDGREIAMKYMIMMFGCTAEAMAARPPEWIAGMQELLMGMDAELRECGEWVAGDALADPSQAATVVVRNGAPVATDGPFAEIKESLAGFWIIEASRERAVELASRVVAYTGYPMEVRQVMDAPAEP